MIVKESGFSVLLALWVSLAKIYFHFGLLKLIPVCSEQVEFSFMNNIDANLSGGEDNRNDDQSFSCAQAA